MGKMRREKQRKNSQEKNRKRENLLGKRQNNFGERIIELKGTRRNEIEKHEVKVMNNKEEINGVRKLWNWMKG